MKLKNAIYTNEEVNTVLVEKLIKKHSAERLQMLGDYYEGKHHAILDRKESKNRPNNKIVNGYPAYIVDMFTGYSTGNPVSYTSVNNDYMTALQDVFNLNDEQDQNSELAKECSIKGLAYEIVYTDENANIRFDMLESDEVITVYDTKLNPELRFAIRLYAVDEFNYVEVYTDREVIKYLDDGGLTEINRYVHNLQEVPVIEYINNSNLTGDFENVLSLIDAYDIIQSDSLNDSEQFADAYLILENALGTESDDLDNMREQRAFVLPKDGKVYYLTKDINDTVQENIKDRLNKDIHKFSGVIDVTDENTFGADTSGVAFRYKLLALENKVANKERKFKKGLQKRIKLITDYLNLKGGNFNYTDVNIIFQRNLPEDESLEIDNAIKLKGLVSDVTALSTLSMVSDVQAELELMKSETDIYDLDFSEVVEDDSSII